jgi:hypothetical protein
MLNKALFIIGLLSMAGILFLTDGCSLVGLGIGSSIDKTKPDTILIPDSKIEKIRPGTHVKLLLDNGEEITGEYLGLDFISAEEYAGRYSLFREQKQSEILLPQLGENITIKLQSGIQGEREFWGFDYPMGLSASVPNLSQHLSISKYAMVTRSIGDTATGIVLLADIAHIKYINGNTVDGSELIKLSSQVEIPILTAISLKNSVGKKHIALDKVSQIKEVPKKTYYKWIGLGLGAAIDAYAIFVIVAIANWVSD